MVNFFKVIRNPYTAAKLIHQLQLTPYSRKEFDQAYLPSNFSIERARRLVIRSMMGFGGTGGRQKTPTGFRHQLLHTRQKNDQQTLHSPVESWRTYPAALRQISRRLQGVLIEHQPALTLIERYNDPQALLYVDPPYVWSTRGSAKQHGYRHEMDDQAHHVLLDTLCKSRAKVVLSGYDCALYNQRLKHWKKVTKVTYATGARQRVEVLWIKGE